MGQTSITVSSLQVVFYTYFRYYLVAETLCTVVMLIDKVGDLLYATQQIYEVVCCCRDAGNAPYLTWWGARNKDR